MIPESGSIDALKEAILLLPRRKLIGYVVWCGRRRVAFKLQMNEAIKTASAIMRTDHVACEITAEWTRDTGD